MWKAVRQLTGRKQDGVVEGITAETLNRHYANISHPLTVVWGSLSRFQEDCVSTALNFNGAPKVVFGYYCFCRRSFCHEDMYNIYSASVQYQR